MMIPGSLRFDRIESQETIPASAAELAAAQCGAFDDTQIEDECALEDEHPVEIDLDEEPEEEFPLVDAPYQEEVVDEEPEEPADKMPEVPEVAVPQPQQGAPQPPDLPLGLVEKVEPPLSTAATINSRTHPAAYAKMSRFCNNAKKMVKFPEMGKMWSSGQKDVLFQQWVSNQGDPDAIECKLKVVASQKREGVSTMELLTVAQMRVRGFTEYLLDSNLNTVH